MAADDLNNLLPPFAPKLYEQVDRSGEHLPFERVYQEPRQLTRAEIRLRVEPTTPSQSSPRGVWSAQLLAAIQGLLAEPSWAWPAYVRDQSGLDPSVIDLFAAGTANLCGRLATLFGPWLLRAIVAALRQQVLDEIIQLFLANPERYQWTAKPSDKNAVWHQELLSAVLTVELESEPSQRLLDLSRQHLHLFGHDFNAGGPQPGRDHLLGLRLACSAQGAAGALE